MNIELDRRGVGQGMSKKRYAAIICEYNPFHHGHLLQIELLKKEYDGIVCIMSGNLVQRGEVAAADKYHRAKAALMCGASLVVELPFPFCMLSARDFAFAGVYIASCLGVDALGFGCEDDFTILERISQTVNTPSFEEKLGELIKSEGKLSYPKAKEQLVKSLLGTQEAEMLRKPNNILTLEYLAAIRKGGYPIKTHPVKRDMTLRSSSSIRAEKDRAVFLSQLPLHSAAVYGGLSEDELPRSTENLSQYIIGTLRMLNQSGRINDDIYSTPQDLLISIMSTAERVSSFSQIVDICQNSIYTAARVRRSILSMVFGITTQEALCKPKYTLLLAADGEGRSFLKSRKKSISLPVITKPSHIKREEAEVQTAFFRAAAVDSVLALAAPSSYGERGGLEKTPFILDRNTL